MEEITKTVDELRGIHNNAMSHLHIIPPNGIPVSITDKKELWAILGFSRTVSWHNSRWLTNTTKTCSILKERLTQIRNWVDYKLISTNDSEELLKALNYAKQDLLQILDSCIEAKNAMCDFFIFHFNLELKAPSNLDSPSSDKGVEWLEKCCEIYRYYITEEICPPLEFFPRLIKYHTRYTYEELQHLIYVCECMFGGSSVDNVSQNFLGWFKQYIYGCPQKIRKVFMQT